MPRKSKRRRKRVRTETQKEWEWRRRGCNWESRARGGRGFSAWREELKYKSDEARKEKLGKDWETKQSDIKSAKPLAAAEHVSFIQDETIPAYSETEQTILMRRLMRKWGANPTSSVWCRLLWHLCPDEPGTFDTIHGMKPPTISVASELSSKGFAVDQEPVLSAYATNIIAAPLAEEEHISSATLHHWIWQIIIFCNICYWRSVYSICDSTTYWRCRKKFFILRYCK